MPSTAIDSSLFGNAFSSEPMRKVFSDENRIRKYLEFEAALATVQGRLGIIPADAAAEIAFAAFPGEVIDPKPNSLKSLPADTADTTPASAAVARGVMAAAARIRGRARSALARMG